MILYQMRHASKGKHAKNGGGGGGALTEIKGNQNRDALSRASLETVLNAGEGGRNVED